MDAEMKSNSGRESFDLDEMRRLLIGKKSVQQVLGLTHW